MIQCSPRSNISTHCIVTIGHSELTHWGRDKMATISQMTLSNSFSWMKMLEFWLKFHWNLFHRGPINNIPALVQIMAWRHSGDKRLSETMMVSSPMHICVTRPQWVNMHNHFYKHSPKQTCNTSMIGIETFSYTLQRQNLLSPSVDKHHNLTFFVSYHNIRQLWIYTKFIHKIF